MLINLEPYGRLGNRLFLGAHLIAFSEHYRVPVLNLGLAEYAPLFPWMEGNAGMAYPWVETGTPREVQKLRRRHQVRAALPWTRKFRYWGSADYLFDGPEGFPHLDALQRNRDVYLSSWLFRGYGAVARSRDAILRVFRFSEAVVGEATDWIAEVRAGADCLVGVHVRWEDYRGTEFYLDQSGFRTWMEAFRDRYPDRKVRFLLFSNEPLPETGWGTLDVRRSPGTRPEFDLQAMSRCQWLLAPPSTFSGWASFVGQVPLLTIGNRPSSMTDEDFQVVKG
jgi:hypothetical protein